MSLMVMKLSSHPMKFHPSLSLPCQQNWWYLMSWNHSWNFIETAISLWQLIDVSLFILFFFTMCPLFLGFMVQPTIPWEILRFVSLEIVYSNYFPFPTFVSTNFWQLNISSMQYYSYTFILHQTVKLLTELTRNYWTELPNYRITFSKMMFSNCAQCLLLKIC